MERLLDSLSIGASINGTLSLMETLQGDLSVPVTINGTLSVPDRLSIDLYEGEYEFTPSQSAQIVSIAGLQATQNITINPIPSNYGLITWNGAVLTVS